MQAEAVMLKDVFPYLRRRSTFLRRMVYGGIPCAVVALGGTLAGFAGAAEQARTGAVLFDGILWLALVLGTLECTFYGATSISRERQANTYDTWILAGMEHFGVVTAKCACVLMRSMAAVLALLCPAVIALYLGGRTTAEALVGFLAVASIFVFVTALSVAVSAFFRKTSDSIVAVAAAVIAVAIAPGALLSVWADARVWGSSFALWVVQIHPFALLQAIGREQGPGFVTSALTGFFFFSGLSLLVMTAAGLCLRRDAAVSVKTFRPFQRLDSLLARLVPPLFTLLKPPAADVDRQCVLYRERLALANSSRVFGAMTISDKAALSGAGLTVLFLASTAAGPAWLPPRATCGVVATSLAVLSFLYVISFIVRVSQVFSREFETGQMELLLLTGQEEAIVTGKIRAYVWHFAPVVAMNLVFAAAFLGLSIRDGSLFSSGSFQLPAPLRPVGYAAAGVTAVSIGIFSSLYFRQSLKATLSSLIAYLLLPGFGALMLGGMFATAYFAVGSPFPVWPFQLAAGVVFLTVLVMLARKRKAALIPSQSESIIPAAAVATIAPPLFGAVLGPFVILAFFYMLTVRNYRKLVEGPPPAVWHHDRGPMLPGRRKKWWGLGTARVRLQRQIGPPGAPGRTVALYDPRFPVQR